MYKYLVHLHRYACDNWCCLGPTAHICLLCKYRASSLYSFMHLTKTLLHFACKNRYQSLNPIYQLFAFCFIVVILSVGYIRHRLPPVSILEGQFGSRFAYQSFRQRILLPKSLPFSYQIALTSFNPSPTTMTAGFLCCPSLHYHKCSIMCLLQSSGKCCHSLSQQ